MDLAELYRSTREQLLALAAELDEQQLASAVAPLPGWTVRDTYAHLAGVCADTLDGRMDDAGSPAWSAAQLAERRGRPVTEIVAEWAARGPAADELLRSPEGGSLFFLGLDAFTHSNDICATVGRSGAVAPDPRLALVVDIGCTAFDRRFREGAVPALRVVLPSGDHVLGDGEPTATLHVDDYELTRILFGRRSRAQIEAATWDGHPAPFVEHLHLFELPTVDLAG